MAEREQLQRGLAGLSLTLSEQQQDQLLHYLALLIKWNRAYNLTAIRDPQEMVSKHLLDSLSVAPFIRGERLLDVGTGAGLPGIPLAIVYPEKEFELLDANSKKTRFLTHVVAELVLTNVKVHHCRIEAGKLGAHYQGILSRAFASLADMTAACGPLLAEGGELLAMKGQYPEEELSQLPKPYIVKGSHALVVPGLTGERHLIRIGPDHTP
ncbi:16S rRNA (guanine(527)-N(7))-methyltransferase RsmG [Litorivivens sp.]|uniref:16S rRNA (guanine(527)-N(7))-methyltransferase RsmG n=1 Tax=Litorivivens sp. TaxID=2020868 RepID=UPI003567A886